MMKRPLLLLLLCFSLLHTAHAQFFEFGKLVGDTSYQNWGGG